MWSQQFNERLKEEAAPVGLTSSEILRSSSSPPHSPVRAPEELLLLTCMARLQAGKGKEGELLRKTIHFFHRDNFEIAGAQVRLQKSPSLSPDAWKETRAPKCAFLLLFFFFFSCLNLLFVCVSQSEMSEILNKQKNELINPHPPTLARSARSPTWCSCLSCQHPHTGGFYTRPASRFTAWWRSVGAHTDSPVLIYYCRY